MKPFKQAWVAVALVGIVLAWSSAARADIASWSCDTDGDGAIDQVTTGWGETVDGYDLNIAAHQHWGPGHMVMDFSTGDDPTDPTIKSINEVTNDTGLAWTGYLVNLTLDTNAALTGGTFTLSNLAVTLPGDWTASVTSTPHYVGAGPIGFPYEYAASIVLASGTPVGNGDELDFSYKISFTGATLYHAVQEQMPVSTVPEPGTLVLTLSGLLGLAVVSLKRRRRA